MPSPELDLLAQRLPPGFRELAIQHKLSHKILEPLERLTLAQIPRSESDNSSCDNHVTFRSRKSRVTHTGFWDACPSLTIPDVGAEPVLEKLLCLALLLYCSTLFSSETCINNIAMWTRRKLSGYLPLCIQPRDQQEEECLFWIWTLTVSSWKTHTGVYPPHALALLSAQKERFPDVDMAVGLRILGKFFCNDALVRFFGKEWVS